MPPLLKVISMSPRQEIYFNPEEIYYIVRSHNDIWALGFRNEHEIRISAEDAKKILAKTGVIVL